ncbi:MAG TPA: ABC transporter substrate-binding protein [Acetobacteraceae bacterium]|nr:ABC transporter substrate-binding protein [Acetobacteraceae bacterium]
MLKRRALMASAAALPLTSAIQAAWAATPKDTVVFASQIDDLITFDPGEAYEISAQIIASSIYDRLVRYEAEDMTKLVGGVAESWTVSPDAKTYTFTLRPNQKFESGATVTADDMAFSLQRVVIMNKTPAFLLTQLGWNKDNVKSLITAPDASTLKFTITENFSPSLVLNLMATVAASVVEKKVAMANEANGDLGNTWLKTHSATSGPYRLVSWKANESVTLEANPGYHLGMAKTKRVVVRHVPEPGSQRLLLEKGDIDIALSLQPDQLKALAENKDINIESFPYSGTWYIGLNLADARLKNPKVRLALNYLVDYHGMANTFLKGRFVVHQTFLPIGLSGAIAYDPYKLDIAKAKSLLAEAGYPDGFELRLSTSNSSPEIDIAQSVQQTMGLGGVKVNIVATDRKQMIAEFRARKQMATLLSWTPDYLDPHTNASTFAFNDNDSDDAPHPLAWRCHYFDPAVNAKTTAAVQEIDPLKRKAMYEELQKIITDDGPYILMFQPSNEVASRANVKGYKPGIVEDLYFFRTITKS